LNKTRSKKDLKNNKFQSTAVAYLYNNKDGAAGGGTIEDIDEELPDIPKKSPLKKGKKAGFDDVDDIINQYS